jgi:hypothetical protein
MYLLHICIVFHFLSVFVFIYTGKQAERKITAGLYVREGSENETLPDLRSRPEAGTLGLLPAEGSIFRPFSYTKSPGVVVGRGGFLHLLFKSGKDLTPT